jgi:transcriptional regulator with XRE-family HTH domain
MAAKKTPNDSSGMGERIRTLMTERSLNQQDVEQAIGASRGFLSRIISGKRGQKISPEYLTSIASVLRVSTNYLRWGGELDEAAIMTPVAGLSPRLEDIAGYREAEFEVIRQNPAIPFAVFEDARQTRVPRPPAKITAEYLGGLVHFLASSFATVDQTDAVKATLGKTTRSKTVRR